MARYRARSKNWNLPKPLAHTWREIKQVFAWTLPIAIGMALALALISYRSFDPSWNATGAGEVQNWLGKPGALIADFLLQSFGMASALLAVAFIMWGWRRRLEQDIPSKWLRLLYTPALLLLVALFSSTLPTPDAWPFAGGLGGLVGGLLLGKTLSLIPFHSPLVVLGVGILAFAASAGLLLLTLGMSWQESKNLFHGIISYSIWAFSYGVYWLKRAHAITANLLKREAASIAPPLPLEAAAPPPPPEIKKKAIIVEAPVKPKREPVQTKLDLASSDDFQLPPADLLAKPTRKATEYLSPEALEANARLLESVLNHYGVKGEIVKVRPGPVVTLYELEPVPGTKSARVISLADDIARSMSATSVRVAVIPGRSVMGIELPNRNREAVAMRDLLEDKAYNDAPAALPLILGKDIGGLPIIVDLSRMPHLLIAGTTGSGKSVAVNAMILSLLYRLTPEQCRLILIDPKMLELSAYEDIPHLLTPVVTDPKKAVVALKWTVKEMESRYRAMSKLGVRNIEGYNIRLQEAREKGEVLIRSTQTGFDPETGKPIFEDQPLDLQPLPYIVVVVDEMADLMMVAGKEIEGAIQRLAQMARAAGIHLLMATQRPSVDVITGTIKANFPTRISFQVTSKIDSRTILGEAGAEQLLGQGDMLYMAGGGRITRVHGPFVTDKEVEKVAKYLRDQGAPVYHDDVTADPEEEAAFNLLGEGGEGGDDLYSRAVELVCREKKASTSFIQRHLQIGYNRAARIMDQMEERGVVSPANHAGKREVLIDLPGQRYG